MASSEDCPELTIAVIGEQVAQVAREGRLIAGACLVTPEAPGERRTKNPEPWRAWLQAGLRHKDEGDDKERRMDP
jgi:hypothetical protein